MGKKAAPAVGVKRASPEASDKKKKEPAAKKKKSIIEETTNEHYRVIDEILGYRVIYLASVGHAVGLCGLTGQILPFCFFPVLTRAPPSSGTLPVRIGSDRGYFAGGDKPSSVRIAIIEAYLRTHPNANPVKQGWVNWEVWHHNLQYYGTGEFNSGPGALDDIRDRLMKSYAFGGFSKSPQEKIARTCTQKRYQLAESAAVFFAERMPEGLPAGVTFMPYDFLLQQNQKLKLANEEKVLLDAGKLKKKVAEAEENSSDEDDDAAAGEDESSSEE